MGLAKQRPSRLVSAVVTLLTLCFLSSCAVISEEECFDANWQQRGLNDGNQGYTTARLNEYLKICSRAGANVNSSQYLQGHQQGVQLYCTPERGRQEGLKGRTYRGVCPANLEAGFLHAYQPAYDVYRKEQALNRINSRIQQKERELRKTKDSKKRRRLREDIRSLDREAAYTRREIRRLD